MFTFEVASTSGVARTGTITTPRGTIQTPCFMPVGTRAAVQTLTSHDLADLEAQIILGNTYHLMLRPGADLIEEMGGLHGFMNWPGFVLTDSGGYQIFSLEPKVDDEGALFRSTYDGSKHKLTPESAVDIQIKLGSDIQMVLDVCPPLPAPESVILNAVDQTHRWAVRARSAFLDSAELADGMRAQFGIVQGGLDLDLRVKSANFLTDIGFEGYGIGGLSVGEKRTEMLSPLRATTDVLPVDQPRYLMGVGDPLSIVEGIANGVDMFDCVLPTRLARHGTVLTTDGRINLKNAQYARDPGPVDPKFANSPLAPWSCAYLRHLLQVKEQAASRLLTLHNIAFLFDLVDQARAAIEDNTIDELVDRVARNWS
ncbi:tRNA guanosine(34) transglycosylase Tgt [Acidimicrobiales bacterium]|nr:tRNA guanosine(34) transglycosylase Tgt [Acidimicrobiales bacterium]